MNKRGIAFFYYFMVGITAIVLGIALASPAKQMLDLPMNADNLNCASPASDWDKATCYIIDLEKPMLIGMIIIIGIIYLTKRGGSG